MHYGCELEHRVLFALCFWLCHSTKPWLVMHCNQTLMGNR